VKPC